MLLKIRPQQNSTTATSDVGRPLLGIRYLPPIPTILALLDRINYKDKYYILGGASVQQLGLITRNTNSKNVEST